MNNSMSCSGGRWCERADALLGIEGIHVSSVTATGAGLLLRVETGETVSGSPECGVVAVGHGPGRSGSMTSLVSVVPCGCCGPRTTLICEGPDKGDLILVSRDST